MELTFYLEEHHSKSTLSLKDMELLSQQLSLFLLSISDQRPRESYWQLNYLDPSRSWQSMVIHRSILCSMYLRVCLTIWLQHAFLTIHSSLIESLDWQSTVRPTMVWEQELQELHRIIGLDHVVTQEEQVLEHHMPFNLLGLIIVRLSPMWVQSSQTGKCHLQAEQFTCQSLNE